MEKSCFTALLALKEIKRKIFFLIDDFVKKERISNLKSSHVLVLYYIGDRIVPIKSLAYSGIYDGSNPSYLIRSMIKRGYLISKPCPNDMRVVLISTTDKGKKCFEKMKIFFKSLEGAEGINLDSF